MPTGDTTRPDKLCRRCNLAPTPESSKRQSFSRLRGASRFRHPHPGRTKPSQHRLQSTAGWYRIFRPPAAPRTVNQQSTLAKTPSSAGTEALCSATPTSLFHSNTILINRPCAILSHRSRFAALPPRRESCLNRRPRPSHPHFVAGVRSKRRSINSTPTQIHRRTAQSVLDGFDASSDSRESIAIARP